MTLHVGDHVADQHDQLVAFAAGKELSSIAGTFEAVEVDAVVHHADFLRRKVVLLDKAVADGFGIGQQQRRPALEEAENFAAL